MRKPAFCICENKDTDQLRGNIDRAIPLLHKCEISVPSQFVLKSTRTHFGQFVLKSLVNSYSFGQFVLMSGQFVLILVDTYSFWSIRTHTQMSTNRPK